MQDGGCRRRAAWAGGIGPALLAALLSLVIAWYFYVGTDGFRLDSMQKAVSLGLFAAVSLCIAGIASALRAAREQAQRLVRSGVARQKALEEARGELARERDRFAVTLASIGDGVIATDAAGNVTFMNATAEKLTGWPSDEAINRPIAKVFRVVDEESREPLKTPVEGVIHAGGDVGLDPAEEPAEHDEPRTHEVDEGGQPDAEPPARLVERPSGRRIARGAIGEDRVDLGAASVIGATRTAEQGAAPHLGLPAAGRAAPAGPPTDRVHRHVPDLARVTGRARQRDAAHDGAAADTHLAR
jgi:PAS domain-containing protein